VTKGTQAGGAAASRRPPALSVILPTYNAAPFLDAALAGVAAQSRLPDEVVVLDDASVDDTIAIARRWDSLLPLTVVPRPQNGGLGAARGLAIERSSGELLALLDADDYWLPDHLAVMLDCHRRHDGIVTPNHYRWVAGQLLGSIPHSVSQPLPPPDEQPRAILTANFLSSGSVFRRYDYERVGGYRELRRSEDWDLWIRMIRAGCRVTRPRTVTLLYRRRPDSLSALNGCIEADIGLLEGLLPNLEGVERADVERLLRRQRARLHLLRGLDDAAAGDLPLARRRWARALVTDPSLRLGDGIHGSTTLRAALCLISPRRALALRDRRRDDPNLTVK
jgi:glycosyltransferase involved in cell wall biosynthesis